MNFLFGLPGLPPFKSFAKQSTSILETHNNQGNPVTIKSRNPIFTFNDLANRCGDAPINTQTCHRQQPFIQNNFNKPKSQHKSSTAKKLSMHPPNTRPTAKNRHNPIHRQPSSQNTANNTKKSAPNKQPELPPLVPKPKTIVCRFYKSGSCVADPCQFSHDLSIDTIGGNR